MKRDDDLIRAMLFEMEDSEDFVFAETLDGEEDGARRLYHRRLMRDVGLIVFDHPHQYRMTSSGHDYLDAIRSETVWSKTKDGAKSLGGASLQLMAEIAAAYLKQEAAEKLGIDL